MAAFADGWVKFIAEADLNDDAAVGTEDSVYAALLTPGGYDVGLAGGRLSFACAVVAPDGRILAQFCRDLAVCHGRITDCCVSGCDDLFHMQ